MSRENTTLDDIASVIGLNATVKLAAWFGGLGNMFVPREATEGQLLVKLIGLSAAKLMTAEWGGTHMAVPALTSYEQESRRHLIGRMLVNKFSTAEVAKHMQMSQRRVEQVCRELEQVGLIPIVLGPAGRKPKSAQVDFTPELDSQYQSVVKRPAKGRFRPLRPSHRKIVL